MELASVLLESAEKYQRERESNDSASVNATAGKGPRVSAARTEHEIMLLENQPLV